MRMESWGVFDGRHKEALEEYGAQIADTLLDGHGDQSREVGGNVIIGSREDPAYLQAFDVIASLQLGIYGRHRLMWCFKRALVTRGLSAVDASLHVAQFWTFFWIQMISLTDGAARDYSRAKAQKSVASVYRLRNKAGRPALFI